MPWYDRLLACFFNFLTKTFQVMQFAQLLFPEFPAEHREEVQNLLVKVSAKPGATKRRSFLRVSSESRLVLALTFTLLAMSILHVSANELSKNTGSSKLLSTTGINPEVRLKKVKNNLADTVVINVKGRVLNEEGAPVEGVSIQVKGKSKGSISDEQGAFTINNVNENAVLVISGVNIENYEVKLNGRSSLQLTTKIAVKPLEESVVKGYYRTSKRTNTGSVGTVTAEKIANQPVTDPLSALQGRVPVAHGVLSSDSYLETRSRHPV